jgi:hypothetical protein
LLAVACDRAPSPAEIVDRSWRAHELVIRAGERAATCTAAAAAMRAVFALTRDAFAEARLLERDPGRFADATAYLQQHTTRRMVALAERCGDHAAVMAVFRDME